MCLEFLEAPDVEKRDASRVSGRNAALCQNTFPVGTALPRETQAGVCAKEQNCPQESELP